MTVDELTLLPRPRSVRPAEGVFEIGASTRIWTGATPSDHRNGRRVDCRTRWPSVLGFSPPIVPSDRGPREGAVSLVLTGVEGGNEAYTLRIGEDGVVIAASGEAGLFYGVQTLIQIARLTGRIWPGLEIEDRPVLPVRGLMLDVSRGRVPRLETLIELVRTLAHYKYNHLQLYTEHTFRFPSHPEIGVDAGSLTPDDVLALDAVCREYHVELVPNLQSVGHFQAMLKLPRYAASGGDGLEVVAGDDAGGDVHAA